jgi:imidazole glycerol phosphate synthase glutamine amidotransferase subunit
MIGIIDYGMSNLGSVMNACRHLALPAELISKPAQMDACRALIFPGQGAFGDCVKHLQAHGFVEPLKNWIRADRPFLGICLGLQTLFEGSEEAPGVAGLALLPGTVRKFALPPEFKIPQIGWNQVRQRKPDCPLFRGLPDGSHAYFVHSYYVESRDPAVVAGETDYGILYASVVWRGGLMAVQFHPEKSQSAGLRILGNFGSWVMERASLKTET